MHIAIFIDQMSRVGGSERVVSNLCRAWAEAGDRVTLITLGPDREGVAIPAAVERRSLSVRVKRGGLMGLLDSLLNGFRLGRLLRELQPDAALAVSTVASLQLAFARCADGLVKIGSEHGYARHYRLPFHVSLARRLLYPRLDLLVCPAEKSARAVAEDCPGTVVRAIPNPLVLPVPPSGRAVDPASILRSGRRHFCTSARFEPLKRIDELLEAFAIVAPVAPEWDLVILGDGPLRGALHAQVDALGLADRVRMPGMVGNPADWYAACDLFVFSSHSEGFGMVLAEAMAHGLPCVSYDCDAGPADIVRDGVDGDLVPVGDVRALAARMSVLAADDALRVRRSRLAREAGARYSPGAVLALWREAIRSVLTMHEGGPRP
ncbi:MAG: glycosyltransferase family 4 protein [Opitutales bacterium]